MTLHPAPDDRVTVHKLDAHGREITRYAGRLIDTEADRVVLEAEFGREAREVGGLRMEPGDRFVETFYFARWYNAFAVHQGSGGTLRGWYANVARPARLDGPDLYSEDLALDLVVRPDRTYVVLDREEFDALEIPSEDRRRAESALAELIELAITASPPFHLRP